MNGISGVDAFDALVFGAPMQNNLDYFNQQYQNFIQNANQFVGDLGAKFVQAASNIYNNYVSPTAIQRIKSILRQTDIHDEHSKAIVPLMNLEDIQRASLTMQRWVMANPVVRERYHNQQLDGYSDTYLDMDPGSIGMTHYDYRMVTEGTVEIITNEHDEPEGTLYKQYFMDSELRDGDSLLDLGEKVDIKDTWSIVEAYLRKGDEDPTSSIGGYL